MKNLARFIWLSAYVFMLFCIGSLFCLQGSDIESMIILVIAPIGLALLLSIGVFCNGGPSSRTDPNGYMIYFDDWFC